MLLFGASTAAAAAAGENYKPSKSKALFVLCIFWCVCVCVIFLICRTLRISVDSTVSTNNKNLQHVSISNGIWMSARCHSRRLLYIYVIELHWHCLLSDNLMNKQYNSEKVSDAPHFMFRFAVVSAVHVHFLSAFFARLFRHAPYFAHFARFGQCVYTLYNIYASGVQHCSLYGAMKNV